MTLTEHYAQCTGHRAELITSHDANPGVTIDDGDETHEMVTRAEPLTIDEPNERNLSKIAHSSRFISAAALERIPIKRNRL